MFSAVLILLFVANVALMIVWCTSMTGMAAMPMPGGWTMSMTWMVMCGQTWLDAAVSFLGMWIVMMVAMMLPSLALVLWRYREAVPGVGGMCDGLLMLQVGLGYFAMWALSGVLVFPLGAALADVAMKEPMLARAVPMAAAIVVVLAGAFQFSGWKARHLASCRAALGHGVILQAATAWRWGLRLGRHCICSCAGLTVILLVTDVMNLIVMAAVAIAITIERVAPDGTHIAHISGVVAIGAGLLLIARAVALA